MLCSSARALQQAFSFTLHNVSVLCRGAVSEPAEAAGNVQLILCQGAQSPSQAGLQAGQPTECAQVVAVCRRGGAEADQVSGLQLAPVRAGESSAREASSKSSAALVAGAPSPMQRTSVIACKETEAGNDKVNASWATLRWAANVRHRALLPQEIACCYTP